MIRLLFGLALIVFGFLNFVGQGFMWWKGELASWLVWAHAELFEIAMIVWGIDHVYRSRL